MIGAIGCGTVAIDSTTDAMGCAHPDYGPVGNAIDHFSNAEIERAMADDIGLRSRGSEGLALLVRNVSKATGAKIDCSYVPSLSPTPTPSPPPPPSEQPRPVMASPPSIRVSARPANIWR